MSYTPGFYRNVGSSFTFQSNMQNIPEHYPLPLPPPPPVTPSVLTPELSDQQYIGKFENRIRKDILKPKVNKASISQLHKELHDLVLSLNDIQSEEAMLSKDIDTLSDDEWKGAFDRINIKKEFIKKTISKLSSSYIDISKKYVAKRTAKRLRLKRLREERKRNNKERIKQMLERSRMIDENLQIVQDDIQKAKQEEEAKMQADMILKEVTRKKLDAKKSIAKLDALLKLRRARQKTAKGRGQAVSDAEADSFQHNIDRIKKLWECKLLSYEKEETDSRLQLEKSNMQKDSNLRDDDVTDNLVKWREVLFGGNVHPQVDFKGCVAEFVSIRTKWDRYIGDGVESTPLPVGWVVPTSNN